MPSLEDRIADLQRYVARIPEPGMSNYKMVLASWKKVIEELLGILMDAVKNNA